MGTSARITWSEDIGRKSRGFSIPLAFLSVNKTFRGFCYPCIPIEKEHPCENFCPQFCCVFLLCPPFLRKSKPLRIRSVRSTSAAMKEQRESCSVPPKKCRRRIT